MPGTGVINTFPYSTKYILLMLLGIMFRLAVAAGVLMMICLSKVLLNTFPHCWVLLSPWGWREWVGCWFYPLAMRFFPFRLAGIPSTRVELLSCLEEFLFLQGLISSFPGCVLPAKASFILDSAAAGFVHCCTPNSWLVLSHSEEKKTPQQQGGIFLLTYPPYLFRLLILLQSQQMPKYPFL